MQKIFAEIGVTLSTSEKAAWSSTSVQMLSSVDGIRERNLRFRKSGMITVTNSGISVRSWSKRAYKSPAKVFSDGIPSSWKKKLIKMTRSEFAEAIVFRVS